MGLAVLIVFTLAALVGFAVFGQHPELLANSPNAIAVYSFAFAVFARGQVLIAFGALAIVLAKTAKAQWLPAFAAAYVLSLGSELLGTTVGLPFGPYQYTSGLGPRWFGHVPLLIPLSWFMMALPSLVLAARSESRGLVVRGALLLLTWDLALDPAMSRVTTYWTWGNSGPYYGMPWLNLFGWFVTGLALMAVLIKLGALEWTRHISTTWLAMFYGTNLLLPLGMNATAGYWGAIAATLFALAMCATLGIALPREQNLFYPVVARRS